MSTNLEVDFFTMTGCPSGAREAAEIKLLIFGGTANKRSPLMV